MWFHWGDIKKGVHVEKLKVCEEIIGLAMMETIGELL
jgi:hypothetical protein